MTAAAKQTKPAGRTATKPARIRKLTRRHKKKVVRSTKKLPSSFIILGRAMRHIWQNKKLFAGILLIFAFFYVLLVKGLANNFQLSETRDIIDETLGNEASGIEKSVTLFGALIGTSGATNGEAASVYQTFLFIIISLVIIWSLRQTYDGKSKVRLKDAFYRSMSPFITYIIVGMFIILQALPALIAVTLFGTVVSSGLAVGAVEQIIWFIVFIAGMALSTYWLSSSLFASYIVTLPDMQPRTALRSARKLVRYQRWSIIRKVLFLPLFVLLCFAVIFLPLVLALPIVAEVLFFILSISLILISHTYFYELYRELL